MESISVFDMLKIGVGPSSSHTLGPWRAAIRWIDHLRANNQFDQICEVFVDLYGSISLTGKGHATDIAIMLGLSGYDPIYFPIEDIQLNIDRITSESKIVLDNGLEVPFTPDKHIKYNRKFLEFHPNGITFRAVLKNGKKVASTYYSIGGGFVVQKERKRERVKMQRFSRFPYPIEKATELLNHCKSQKKSISQIVLENELSLRSEIEINDNLKAIWDVMLDSMYVGCHTEGILPGGLNVQRRAFIMHKNLIGQKPYNDAEEWIETIRNSEVKFRQILKWVSCFALAVNQYRWNDSSTSVRRSRYHPS